MVTPCPKFHDFVDTQNDAIFEAGDTFFKPSICSIYGGVKLKSSSWLSKTEVGMKGRICGLQDVSLWSSTQGSCCCLVHWKYWSTQHVWLGKLGRCQNSGSQWVHPGRFTWNLKINGWFRCISYWNVVPFYGTFVSFRGCTESIHFHEGNSCEPSRFPLWTFVFRHGLDRWLRQMTVLSGPFDADCSQTWKALEKSRSYNEMAVRGILDTY